MHNPLFAFILLPGPPHLANSLYYFIARITINMTVQDYLLKFRKISTLESLEKLFDHLNYTLTDNQEIINMYRAADHRRA
ncbi:transcription modulator YdgT, partial [Mycobacterium tuberculosis]|nr:transcription modulator YdgT [Mycobacterium tuberculosis]